MAHNPIVVCRCEEVTLEQLAATLDRYGCSAREAKLRTRAGMGVCGGRTCRPLIERLIAPSEEGEQPLKVQPPVRPITFAEWGDEK